MNPYVLASLGWFAFAASIAIAILIVTRNID